MARRPGTRGPSGTSRNRASSTGRSRTSSRTGTSSRDRRERTSSRDRRERTSSRDRRDRDDSERRPGRKKTQKNNTPLIIGISVGALLLLIIIIAAASGGGGSTSGSGDNYMSLSQKKSIYAEYLAKCKSIEDEAAAGLARLDAETRKMSSRMTGKKVSNLKEAAINRLQGKWKKKIPQLPPEYIRDKVINYGKSNGW